MFNVCPKCGDYEVKREVVVGVDPGVGLVVCGSCGAGQTFIRRPLFVITGASGTGKSTICRELMTSPVGCLALESDILWGAIDAAGEAGVERYWNAWLRMVKNIHQGPQSVILCGTLVPDTLERQPERRYIGDTHYLALVVDSDVQAGRLRRRPAWRESGDPGFIDAQGRFNRWLVDHASAGSPRWDLLDTTSRTVADTTDDVLAWVFTCQERSAARTRSSLS